MSHCHSRQGTVTIGSQYRQPAPRILSSDFQAGSCASSSRLCLANTISIAAGLARMAEPAPLPGVERGS
jgi:hypothetical protein